MTRRRTPHPSGRHRRSVRVPGGTVIVAVHLILFAAVAYEASVILDLVMASLPLRALADATLVAALALTAGVAAGWLASVAFDLSLGSNAIIAAGVAVPPILAGLRPAMRHACGMPPDGIIIRAASSGDGAGADPTAGGGLLCWLYTSPLYPYGVLAVIAVAAVVFTAVIERS